MVNGNYVRMIDTMKLGDVIIIDFMKSPPTVQKNGANYIGHCDRASVFDDMVLADGIVGPKSWKTGLGLL